MVFSTTSTVKTNSIVLAARKHVLVRSRHHPTRLLALIAALTPALTLTLSPTQPGLKRARNGQEALFEFRLGLLNRKIPDNYERSFRSAELVSVIFGVSGNFRLVRIWLRPRGCAEFEDSVRLKTACEKPNRPIHGADFESQLLFGIGTL